METLTISNLERKDETQHLKSPLTEKTQRLQPMREVRIHPYFGARRKLKIFRTHYIIGSDDSCDIKIEDPFISPKHAILSIEAEGDGYVIEDQGSKNGIFLNGLRVQKAPLPMNGNLRLGRSAISWREESSQLGNLGGDWIVADTKMKELLHNLKIVAQSNLPILLLGETGTGKEIFAQLVHRWSRRENTAFVVVNGALTGGSLSESELFGHRKGSFTGSESSRLGAIKTAHGGTLFLDEVADIPASAQIKLLRALESGEVKALGSDQVDYSDFRLVTATSQDIEQKIAENRFRSDLYFRIAGQIFKIPPLRERPEDILAIANFLVRKKGCELDKEAEGKLLSYSWPGNVRELRSVMERSIVLAMSEGNCRIQVGHIGTLGLTFSIIPEATDRPATLEELERRCIQQSLERNGWSRLICAKELGIARSTLFEKMRRYGIRDLVQ